MREAVITDTETLAALNDTAAVLGAKMAIGNAVIGEADGISVGCVFYQHFPDHTYFGRLALLPAYRGNGIAQALIEYVRGTGARKGPVPCSPWHTTRFDGTS